MSDNTEALRLAIELQRCEATGIPLTLRGREIINLLPGLLATKQATEMQQIEPNNDEVICPNCTHQFRAIPVSVQRLMLDAGFEPPFAAPPAAQAEPAAVARVVKWLRSLPEKPRDHPYWTNGFFANDCTDAAEVIAAAPTPAARAGDALPPRSVLPMQVLAALNEAMGGNEWQGDASPHELAVPASQAIAELAALAARGAQGQPEGGAA